MPYIFVLAQILVLWYVFLSIKADIQNSFDFFLKLAWVTSLGNFYMIETPSIRERLTGTASCIWNTIQSSYIEN